MFANTYNKNFRLSTKYLVGTFAYYTPLPYDYEKEYISVVKGKFQTYDSNRINESNAKPKFDGLKLHLQKPEFDPYRR